MADITTHTATATRNARGYVVAIDRIRVKGSAVMGEGFTRDAAAIDAKRKLAAHLKVPVESLSLIVSGDK